MSVIPEDHSFAASLRESRSQGTVGRGPQKSCVKNPLSHPPLWPVHWHFYLHIPHGWPLMSSLLPIGPCLALSSTQHFSSGLLCLYLSHMLCFRGRPHSSHRQPAEPACSKVQPVFSSLKNSQCLYEFDDSFLVTPMRRWDSVCLRQVKFPPG